jgi:hypothetical protein
MHTLDRWEGVQGALLHCSLVAASVAFDAFKFDLVIPLVCAGLVKHGISHGIVIRLPTAMPNNLLRMQPGN